MVSLLKTKLIKETKLEKEIFGTQFKNPLFLSRLFYEKTLNAKQLSEWHMDWIMFTLANQSSLLMSTGQQYEFYVAYIDYLLALIDLDFAKIKADYQANQKLQISKSSTNTNSNAKP